ncbi:MAG: OmpA family protein [Deltaproteobacteria bacterium]|nr:OmpA family protein [Deltaproteobacteria bacterium]
MSKRLAHAAAIVALALCCSPGARAVTITVNTSDDELNGDGDCSLREAVEAANTDSPISGCPGGSGPDIIDFAPALDGASLAITGGQLVLDDDVSVIGPPGRVLLSAGQLSRVFEITTGTLVELQRLVISDGIALGEGGAIRNAGSLTMTDCDVLDSFVLGEDAGATTNGGKGGFGAALWSGGDTLAIRCDLSGNLAAGGDGGQIGPGRPSGGGGAGMGGAAFVAPGGSLTLDRCLLADNKAHGGASWPGGNAGGGAGMGGAVFNHQGSLRVINCTFTGNTARSGPGDVAAATDPTGVAAPAAALFGQGGAAGPVVGGAAGFGGGGGGAPIGQTGGTGGYGGGGAFPGGAVGPHGGTPDGSFSGSGAAIGGAIFDLAGVTSGVSQVTIVGNQAIDHPTAPVTTLAETVAGGLFAHTSGSTFFFLGSIIASNTAGASVDCGSQGASPTSSGRNVVGSGGGCPASGTGDQAVASVGLSFGDHGGPTETFALDAGSPAIGAGSCTDLQSNQVTADQRDLPRPAAGCDSGAYEVVCNDEELTGDEECEDGNASGGDGCSAACTIEPGFVCPVFGASCSCAPGRYGSDCSGVCDCNNGGSCDSGLGGTGACTCLPGFYGADCSGVCDCQNGGTCDQGADGDGSCTCAAGFYGADCTGVCNCDDAFACTTDLCNPVTGACTYIPNDGSCTDAFGCTADACVVGLGCVNTPVDVACDDGVACTVDACSATTGCSNTPDDSACDDGVGCTDDVCDLTAGCGSTPNDSLCDDGLGCTDDVCNALSDCQFPHNGSCGDGIRCAPYEVCDDDNNDDEDGCAADCQATEPGWFCSTTPAEGTTTCSASCGDGELAAGSEECDDGNSSNNDGCLNDCTLATCGDGFIRYGVEACDDLGGSGGDGCSATCQLEAGYTCDGFGDGVTGTSCSPTCGTDFGLATPMGWLAATALGMGSPVFTHTASAPGGFEVAPVAPTATDTTLVSRIAVPALADAPEPELVVHYDLAGDGVTDCVSIYVNGNGLPTSGLEYTSCEETATTTGEVDAGGLSVARVPLGSVAGTARQVVIRFESPGLGLDPASLFVDRVTVGSDIDRDASFEFTAQGASCDRCVDADQDGYGRAVSVSLATCTHPELDCNDSRALSHPNQIEVCDDTFDDDCDGATDLADSECVEDCADGIDNGSNGITDCDDAACASDAFCDPCSIDWTFTSGPGLWQNDAQGLWVYKAAAGAWKTNGGAPLSSAPNPNNGGVPGGVYFGRLQLSIDVPSVAAGGPAPKLAVTFIHEGDAGASSDQLAVCLDQPTCRFDTPGIALLASTPTVGEKTVLVDLSSRVGTTVSVSILYDTASAAQNDNPGATITRVRLASDVDNDLVAEGSAASCDTCWDADLDGYGRPEGPTAGCPFAGDDCNDGLDGFQVHPDALEDIALGNCGDNVDNDCDGFTDGFDSGCGDEDCANGQDDNGDGQSDCDDALCSSDPFCSECSTTFTFATGGGGFQVTTDGAPLFASGFQSTYAANGFETVLNGNVDSSGGGRRRGWLTRSIPVPAAMLAPTLRLRYALEGQPSTVRDIVGVCFDTVPAACDATQGTKAFQTGTNTTGLEEVDIPIPADFKGTSLPVVIFYDTVDANENSNPGVFIDEVALLSDVDDDGLSESGAASCDRCIDVDGDGYGRAEDPPFDQLTTCSAGSASVDCDDALAITRPGQPEVCGDPLGADNNCNGKGDLEEASCSICGDSVIGFDETCDDGNDDPGDGCSATCQTESGALHVTEIHIPKPAGNPGEQWIELYNASTATIDLEQLQLTIKNVVGTSVSFGAGGNCTVLTGSSTIAPGAFFIVAFGPVGGTDNLAPDATCNQAFQISPAGDLLTLTEGGVKLLDQVDFRTGFGCELSQLTRVGAVGPGTGTVGRSLILGALPVTGVPVSKSTASAWCLAGPAATYGSSGTHRGSPRADGGCAEFACDGVDDDCDGPTDELLNDSDSDQTCDEQDCAPLDNRCAASCVDVDLDAVFDCADGCIDRDADGYGTPPAGVPPAQVTCLGLDCNDQATAVNPDGSEGVGTVDSCGDGLDNNCDGLTDCSDVACYDAPNCVGEICQTTLPVTCGAPVTVKPAHDDFPCTAPASGGGADGALRFTAPKTETVVIGVANKGVNRYSMFVFDGSCTNGSCATPLATFDSGCSLGGQKALAVVAGHDYFIVADRIGACAEGAGSDARVSVACGEVCGGNVDEDLDGKTDCADQDCVLDAACAAGDFDQDGVPNGVEIACQRSPVDDGDKPSADDIADPDGDQLLNCEDPDDDNDDFDDADELTTCALNETAKNDDDIFPGAPKNCELFNVDADCNGTYDLFEALCGGKETLCANGIDDDEDGTADCLDIDCVADLFCFSQDFDNDLVSNGFEIACESDPKKQSSVPAPGEADDPDGDDIPNCADLDDDGDGFPDIEELICGSKPLDPLSVPEDTDHDTQCDSADDDDDNDGAPDILEAACGSDSKSATSTPTDADHDLDQDGICDLLDADADDDLWSNALEETCGTDPADAGSNPTASGLDGDGDGLCDAVDDDDDNDLWSDDQEALCGTLPNDPQSVPTDTDGNGECDALDQDVDNDGWANAVELLCHTDPNKPEDNPTALGQDADNDKICDLVDSDDDNDDWKDTLEVQCGTNPLDPASTPTDSDNDGLCNAVDDDDDGDGWIDATELFCQTDPLDAADVPVDTDGDGLCDGVDSDADPDHDGWNSAIELQCGTNPKDPASVPTDVDADGLCDALDPDMDDDGWPNEIEVDCGTDPKVKLSVPLDTDGDSVCNALDQDDDGDGAPDEDELLCLTDPLDPAVKPLELDLKDTDGDELKNCIDPDDDNDDVSDANEAQLGTNPLVKDSDADGLDDGQEDANHDGVTQASETSPTKPDTDGDGLGDGLEVGSCYELVGGELCLGTNPVMKDTDGDGLPDGQEDANHDAKIDPGETSPVSANTDGDLDFAGNEANDGAELACGTDPLDPDDSPVDKDDNGVCDGSQVDSDGDGVADGVELLCGFDAESNQSTPSFVELGDTDGDGDIDCVDQDDDDDGVDDLRELECGTDTRSSASTPDAEAIADFDEDGALNCSDPDDDNDGLSDVVEAGLETDSKDADSDDDGLPDGQEVTLGTDPLSVDTDRDGVQDGTEFGLTSGTPNTAVSLFKPDLDPSTTTDPKDPDTDDDGICDGSKAVVGVCQTAPGEDENDNGRIDAGEGNPNDPKDGLADSDGDGLTDRAELLFYHTDPKRPDTDGDLLSDKLEVEGVGSFAPTDPLVADTDGGGVFDGVEVLNGTDPNDGTDDFSVAELTGGNFTGCAGGGGEGALPWALCLLALAGIAATRRRGRTLWVLGLALGGAGVADGPARAQAKADINVENFFPAGGHYRVWSVEQSLVAPAWRPYGSLLFWHEKDSFQLQAGLYNERLIDHADFVDVNLGVGLFGFAQLEVDLPVAVIMESASDTRAVTPVSGAGLADMQVRVRGRIIDNLLGGPGLGVSVGATVPIGDGDHFRGDKGFGVLGRVIFDWRTDRTVTSVNAGVRIRTKEVDFFNETFGSELTYGLGLEVEAVRDRLTLATELFGHTPFNELFGSTQTTTLEWLLGPKVQIIPGLSVQAAVGTGVVRGIGSPTFRFVAGVQWAPKAGDSDKDGIPDADDRCPTRPEDVDGFADLDGCPDEDNDQDGVPDVTDKCPMKAEDYNGIDDRDGCPDAIVLEDRDGDGVPDRTDMCPQEPETYNGFEDNDGCPDSARALVRDTLPPPETLDDDCRFSIDDVVYFHRANAVLDTQARRTLDAVAQTIASNALIEEVAINGHASQDGTDETNYALSQRRAEAVRDYLVTQGVKPARLIQRGFGESQPRVEGDTEAALRENRSVDFTVRLGGKCAKP